MIVLSSTDSLRVVTSSANALDVLAGWADNTSTTFTPSATATAIAAAATTPIVAAPPASTQRNVSSLSLRAKGGANVITVLFFNGTAFEIVSVSLASGDRLEYENGRGWAVIDSSGALKMVQGASGNVVTTIQDDGAALTQRPFLNFVSSSEISFTGSDDGLNTRSNMTAALINASVAGARLVNNTITATQQAQMAANTVKCNPTAALANESDLAIAVQSALFRGSGNITGGAAIAGQFLGRSLAGGDLSFQLLPGLGTLLRAPQIVTTTNAAFAHPTGTRAIIVEMVGGGGGGGGCAAAIGAVGSGGNSANYGRKTFTSISGTSNITIGAAGTTGSGVAGGNGGASSFVHNAVTFTVPGGTGGTILASGAAIAAATDNAANAANTGADFSIVGQVGEAGGRNTATAANVIAGAGGSNPLGSGGMGRIGANANGRAASGFGAGGGGALASTAATAQTGGAATGGAAIIWEFG